MVDTVNLVYYTETTKGRTSELTLYTLNVIMYYVKEDTNHKNAFMKL